MRPFDRDRGVMRQSRLTVLRILSAQRGFACDRVQAFCKTRERAIGGTASGIRAPLTVLPIGLAARGSAEWIPDKENSERECEGYVWQPAPTGRGAARPSGGALPFPDRQKCRTLAPGHKPTVNPHCVAEADMKV